jgi:hypothetical protein
MDQLKNKDNTENKFRKIIRLFYQWLGGYPRGQRPSTYPPEVAWIAMKKVPAVSISADDLISYAKAVKITKQAICIWDKALFHANLDAGCRKGEILTVKRALVQDVPTLIQKMRIKSSRTSTVHDYSLYQED